MAKAQVTYKMNASAAQALQIIRQFDHVDKWVHDVASISASGNQVGAIRKLVITNGLKCDEILLALDDQQRMISYSSLDTELPFKDYTAVIKVIEQNTKQCEVQWSSEFKVVGIDEAEAVKALETNYVRYLQTVELLCET